MLKRILILATLALAVWVPAALADTGVPGAGQSGQSVAAAARGQNRGQSRGQLRARLKQLRVKIIRATVVFRQRCESGKADPAKCTTAAQRLIAGLKKLDARIGTIVGKIQDRCDVTSGGTAPQGCRRAAQLIKLLENVQARLQALEQKLQDWLDNPPSGAGSSPGPGADGLAPLNKLATALAGARSAANASGL